MNTISPTSPSERSLHPWIGTDPILIVQTLESQALNTKILTSITFTAIAAISVTVVAVSFFKAAPSTTLSVALFLPILTTPGIAFAASQLQMKSQIIERILLTEKVVADHFRKIQSWNDEEIASFFHKYKIPKNASIPISTFLPLIARFEAQQEIALKAQNLANEMLQSAHIPDRTLRLCMRNLGWQKFEREALPAIIEAATILQILKDPTRQNYPSDLFQLTQKSFDERQFDRIYGPDDAYLHFKRETRPPITLEDLMQKPSPEALWEMLFV